MREEAGSSGRQLDGQERMSRGRAMGKDGRVVQREPKPRSRMPALTEGVRVVGSGLWARK